MKCVNFVKPFCCVVNCDFGELKEDYLGLAFGPVIFLSSIVEEFDKEYREFVIQHEIGHVRQFFFTLGLYLPLMFFVGYKSKRLCAFFENGADKYAEKKTGISRNIANKYFEDKIFEIFGV